MTFSCFDETCRVRQGAHELVFVAAVEHTPRIAAHESSVEGPAIGSGRESGGWFTTLEETECGLSGFQEGRRLGSSGHATVARPPPVRILSQPALGELFFTLSVCRRPVLCSSSWTCSC